MLASRLLQCMTVHKAAIFVSVVFGILVSTPTVLSITKIGVSQFRGIYPMFIDDTAHYFSLTRESYDGHPRLGNAFIKEYKEKPYLQPPLAEYLFAREARWLHLSIPAVFAINNFFLSIASLLSFYTLFVFILRNRRWALSMTVVWFTLFLYSSYRPINPQFSMIFFSLGVCLVWCIIERLHSSRVLLVLNTALAIDVGILIYIYPYYWMTIVGIYGICLLLSVLYKKQLRYQLLSGVFFLLPLILISYPYIMNLVQAMADPLYTETTQRFGIVYTRLPASFFNVGLLGLSFLVWFLIRKKIANPTHSLFLLSAIMAGVALNWMNVITGQNMQLSDHFYRSTILIIFFVIAVVFQTLWHVKDRFWKEKALWPVAAGMILLCGIVLIRQWPEVVSGWKLLVVQPDIRGEQHYADVAEWLNTNTEKDAVVLGIGEAYHWLIPIYTHSNSYYDSRASMYLMPDEELIHRWLVRYYFEDIDTVKLTYGSILQGKFLNAYQNREVRRRILSLVTRQEFSSEPMILQTFTDYVFAERAAMQTSGFEQAIKHHAIDYIILDMGEEKNQHLRPLFATYVWLEETAFVNGTVIYAIKNSSE